MSRSSSARREHVLIAWPIVCLTSGMLLWMGRALFTGQIPFTGDLLHWNYPIRDFFANALGHGRGVWWMPSIFGGFDIAGEGQLGAFHPLHWILYGALPLDRAFALELILPYGVVFAGTWLFLRRRIGTSPAGFAAMLFAFGGFTMIHGVHMNMMATVAHIPWLLWTIDRLFQVSTTRQRWRYSAAIAFLTGSQLLFGHPQAVFWSALIAASYLGCLAVASPRPRWETLAPAIVGALLGAGIGAVQWLATWFEVLRSTRPVDNPDFATSFSLPPLQLFQLIEPYIFWGRVLRWNEVAGASDEYAAYAGVVSLALTTWWLANYRRRADAGGHVTSLAWWGLSLAVFGMWMATGGAGKLYYLQTWIPLVRDFRAPVRYVLFAHLGFAVMAGVAMLQLARTRPEDAHGGLRAAWAPWALAVLSAVIAVWLVRGNQVPQGGSLWVAAAGPCLIVAAAALITLAARGVRPALAGLVLLAAADQGLYGLGGMIAWQDFLTRAQAESYLDALPADIPADDGRLARGGFPNLYVLRGYRMIDGYVGLPPKKQLDYRRPHALRVAGVHYAHADFLAGQPIPGAVPLARGWSRLPAPLPRVRMVTRTQVAARPADVIEEVDVDSIALVARELSLANGGPGRASIVTDEPGEIAVAVDAAGTQLLVVSESFNEAWSVEVDGLPARLEQVYGDFIGVVVPQGARIAAFRFRPPFFMPGSIITILSVAAALVLFTGIPGRMRSA